MHNSARHAHSCMQYTLLLTPSSLQICLPWPSSPFLLYPSHSLSILTHFNVYSADSIHFGRSYALKSSLSTAEVETLTELQTACDISLVVARLFPWLWVPVAMALIQVNLLNNFRQGISAPCSNCSTRGQCLSGIGLP